ncbi:fibronectin type III domain-containing protein, partial [Nocardioides sp. GY 10113]|uniref:fibronectin type III domain-containing protein n=1 Tax=Nocardioides sp. GY 10113 TaxID=2569761 RepID=UPI0010A8EADC
YRVPLRNAVRTAADKYTLNGTSTVPTAPEPPTATRGDTTAYVSWIATSGNGSPVTGYTVTSTPGAKTCTTTGALSCTITGLTNGTAYTFTVVATNTIGDSPASDPSTTVTPAGVPAQPAKPTAVRGDQSATITWTAPSTNGAPITGYTVTSTPGAKTCTTTGALSCTITGLTNGTAYTFTVVATNTIGDSPASDPSTTVTPAGVPTQPAKPTAVRGDQSATVTWAKPSGNGSPVTGYTITATPGGATKTVTDADTLTTSIGGLSNGTGYTFTVTATNAVGDSHPSVASREVTPAGVPTQVKKPSARVAKGHLVVTWRAPHANGSPVSRYRIDINKGKDMTVGRTTRKATFRHLGPGRYTVRVIAINAVGASTPSARISIRIR